MKRLVLFTLLLGVSVFAQEQKDKPDRVTKLVTLKYADPNSLFNIARSFGVEVQINPELKVMTLTGRPENITAAEGAVKQFDVAPKNIDLVAYFLVGSNQPNPTGGAVPPEVRDVIAQLKNTFTFKEYSMLDTLTLRTRTGSMASTSGVLDASTSPRMTVFRIRNASIGDEGSIRIDRMHAGLRIPQTSQGKLEYIDTGIDQDVDVKENQKVVVGRASLAGPDKALFVILTAKVVQ